MTNLKWNDLFAAGTLIGFSVHLWRARIRLTPEDLGIEKTEEVQKALSFGCHRLIPAEAMVTINAVVASFQKDIQEHSLTFPLLQGARYVPDNQVKPLQKKLDLRVREFSIAVNEFLEDYEKNMNEMLTTIEQALGKAAKSPEAAASAFSRIIREYPAKEKVIEKFGLEWTFFNISLPTSQAAAQSAKNALPQVSKAVNSMIEQLRSELSEKVSTLLSLAQRAKDGKRTNVLKDGGGFRDRSKQSALAVLQKVDRLNFFGDAVLTEQTNALRRLLESSDMDMISKDLDKVKDTLEQDIQSASEAAEKRLTGLGKRKIQM